MLTFSIRCIVNEPIATSTTIKLVLQVEISKERKKTFTMSTSIFNNYNTMFSQLANNGNTIFSNVFNGDSKSFVENVNTMFSDIVNKRKSKFSDLFNGDNDYTFLQMVTDESKIFFDNVNNAFTEIVNGQESKLSDLNNNNNNDDTTFLQTVKDVPSIFSDHVQDKYNVISEQFNKLDVYDKFKMNSEKFKKKPTFIEEKNLRNMKDNKLVYEPSDIDNSLFFQTTYAPIVFNDNNFVSPSVNSTHSFFAKILMFGNTTIHSIVNEVTTIYDAISNNEKTFYSLFLNYKNATYSRIYNYGSVRMIGEQGYNTIMSIVEPDEYIDTYQLQCHYRRATTITITREMAQKIVQQYGPFGKYHVMNCDGDKEEVTIYKIGLSFFGFMIFSCFFICAFTVYSTINTLSNLRELSRVTPSKSYSGQYNKQIADRQKDYEHTFSNDSSVNFVPAIPIPKGTNNNRKYCFNILIR